MIAFTDRPYADDSVNMVYHLLFCDNLSLYQENTKEPYSYPFDVLFSSSSTNADLQKIIDDKDGDPRIKMLAYNRQRSGGYEPTKKELLAIIVEVALDEGLDVLASFSNGTARYINHSQRVLIWETTDETSNRITNELFAAGINIVKQIGPWTDPRRPHPPAGNVRISFLVSDGLYFGEGPMDVLFNDPLAEPALGKATELMQYLTGRTLEAK